ncbi:unnamed protein product [Malus baccata var. baccata]
MVQHGYELLEMEIDALEEDLTEKQITILKENRMNDARALGIIQGAASNFIFPRIVNEETAKAVWDTLQQEYKGDVKVRKVKLQSLRRDFEYTRMREDEPLKDYFSRLFDVVTQMKTYGEELPNGRIVKKLLISLTKPYDSIVSVIEETKDIDTLNVQDVMVSLRAFDQKLERHADGATEKVFQSLNISGCSNHMTAHESLLSDIDTAYTGKVKMGNGNIVKATGKGTLIIKTKRGRRHIKEVMLVPGLEENLFSVGQMMEHGYILSFGETIVEIYDDMTLSNLVMKVEMKNISFPLLLKCLEEVARKASTIDSERL